MRKGSTVLGKRKSSKTHQTDKMEEKFMLDDDFKESPTTMEAVPE